MYSVVCYYSLDTYAESAQAERVRGVLQRLTMSVSELIVSLFVNDKCHFWLLIDIALPLTIKCLVRNIFGGQCGQQETRNDRAIFLNSEEGKSQLPMPLLSLWQSKKNRNTNEIYSLQQNVQVLTVNV